MFWESECAEARDRLFRVVRSCVARDINSVLPPDFPVWPDSDFTKWPRAENVTGVWAHFPELRAIEAAYVTSDWDVFGAATPYYTKYRRNTRSGLIAYVTRTGDWDYARNVTHAASRIEVRKEYLPVLYWSYLWTEPRLIALPSKN